MQSASICVSNCSCLCALCSELDLLLLGDEEWEQADIKSSLASLIQDSKGVERGEEVEEEVVQRKKIIRLDLPSSKYVSVLSCAPNRCSLCRVQAYSPIVTWEVSINCLQEMFSSSQICSTLLFIKPHIAS